MKDWLKSQVYEEACSFQTVDPGGGQFLRVAAHCLCAGLGTTPIAPRNARDGANMLRPFVISVPVSRDS